MPDTTDTRAALGQLVHAAIIDYRKIVGPGYSDPSGETAHVLDALLADPAVVLAAIGADDRTAAFVRLLEGFGSAIRGDWTQDGRGVKAAMEGATAAVMRGDAPELALHWAGVCPVNNCWDEHCDEYDEWRLWLRMRLWLRGDAMTAGRNADLSCSGADERNPMRPDERHKMRTRTATVTQAAEDLDAVLKITMLGGESKTVFDAAVDRLMAARKGNPSAQQLEGKVSTSMGGASPPPPGTFDRAMAEDDLRDLDRGLRMARDGSRLVLDVTSAYAPRLPDPVAKREAAAANASVPKCSHCKTEDVYRTGDVAGRLSSQHALCRWCYDMVVQTAKKGAARLPSRRELDKRDSGDRVRIRA